jgi:2-dehydropantoate 2-reductase
VEIMMTLGDDKMTSMCQDMIAGRKTEVEMLSGELMRLAEKHGIDVPVNRTLFEMIKTMEMMNGVGV